MEGGNTTTSGNTTTQMRSTQVGSKIVLDEDFTLYDLRNKDYQRGGELDIEAILHDMQRIMIYTLDPFLFYQKYHGEQGNVMEQVTKKEMFEKLIHTKIGTIETIRQTGKKTWVEHKEITLKQIFEEGTGIHANSKRFQARSVKFMTDDPRDFPLFQGYPWKPLPDDQFNMKKILPWLDHVAENICNGDFEVAEWLLNWIAFIVQKPGVKTTVSPMIIGDHGTGKGDFFLDIISKLFGRYALPNVTKIEDITGRFNGILENMVFIGCNEMHDEGNTRKLNGDSLKSLITEYDIIYERKCVNTKKGKFYGNLIFFSNHTIPIDAKQMKRRICIIETNYKVAENLDFFGKLKEVIDDPLFMLNLFTYFAKHRDLSKYQPRKLPITEATTSRMEATTPPWQLFFEKNIDEFVGDESGSKNGGAGDGWMTTECYSAYEHFCKKYGYGKMNASNFGINLKKFCDCKQRKRQGEVRRYYYLNERGMELYKEHIKKVEKMEEDTRDIKERESERDAKIALGIVDPKMDEIIFDD